MKKLTVCLALCGFLVLAGCAAPQPERTPKPPATATMTASATASATLTVTITPTPGLVRPVEFEIRSDLPEGHPYVGNLLLENALRGDGQVSVSMYDLQSGERLLFSEKYFSAGAVSPDHTRFAVENSWGKTYDIYSAYGELIKSFPWKGKGYGLADWLDNERIGILTYTDFRDGWSVTGPDTVTFINTITGEEEVYPPDYPDLDIANQPLYHGKWGTAVFDPDLTRVVYPYNGYFNLYSLPEKKILAELPYFQFRSAILWAADGSYFIAADYNNFYRVSADGEIEQITDFEDSANLSFSIASTYALSPDESRVAFWLRTGNKDQEEIEYVLTFVVLDLKSGEVIDTGIFTEDDSWNEFSGRITPVWSPDSRALIIAANFESDGYDVLLVDIEEQTAFKLPANWYVTGWLLPEEPDAVFPTRTSTPVPVATPTPQPVVSINMRIQPASPENLPYTGNLLLVNPDYGADDTHSFYSLDTGDMRILPDYYHSAHAVSPDRTKFALGNYVKDGMNISVFSSNGNNLLKVEGQKDWGRIADWIDNDTVAIILYEEDEESQYYKHPPAVVVYDFGTGDTKLFPADYPNIRDSWPLHWVDWGATVINSSLTRVVYRGSVPSPHPEKKTTWGYILYSIPEQRKLAELPVNRADASPIWSADGSYFVVRGTDEFYKVSAVGKTEKLTALNPGYRIGKEESLDYFIDTYYSLSPDESHMAFWMIKYDDIADLYETQFTLAILDMESGEVFDTGIPSGHYYFDDSWMHFEPVWSPDSKSLVVSANRRIEEPQSGAEMDEDGNKIPFSKPGGVTRDLVLVDLEKMAAYQLPSDWIPTGWLLPED